MKILQKLINKAESLVQKDTKYLIIGLAFLSVLIVLILTFILLIFEFIFKIEVFSNSLYENLWYTFAFFIDPGLIAEENYSENSQISLTFKLLTTAFGIIAFSTLIATISQVVNDRIEGLRSGQTNVTAVDHIIIIGFTNKTIPLLHEFFEGKENKKETFVIFTSDDPQFIQKQINEFSEFNENKHDIIIKVGTSSSANLPTRLNIAKAKEIIILNESEDDNDHLKSDVEAIEFFTKIVQSNEWVKNPSKIVIEINNPNIAETAKEYCKDYLALNNLHYPIFVYREKFRNLFLSLALNNGYVLEVFQSLFGFQGNEFYFMSLESLIKINNNLIFKEKTFGQILYEFSEITIIGTYWDLKTISSFNNQVIISPSKDFKIKDGMGLVFIDESINSLKNKIRKIQNNDLYKKVNFEELKKPQTLNLSIIDANGFNDDTQELFMDIIHYNENYNIQSLNLVSLTSNKDKTDKIKIYPKNVDIDFYDKINKTKQFLKNERLLFGLRVLPVFYPTIIDGSVLKRPSGQMDGIYFFQILDFVDGQNLNILSKKGVERGDLIFLNCNHLNHKETTIEWDQFLKNNYEITTDFQSQLSCLEYLNDKKCKEFKIGHSKNYKDFVNIINISKDEMLSVEDFLNEFNSLIINKIEYEYNIKYKESIFPLEKDDYNNKDNSDNFFIQNSINKSNKIIWLGKKINQNIKLLSKDYLTQLFFQQASNSPNTFSPSKNNDEIDFFEASMSKELDDALIGLNDKEYNKFSRNLDIFISTDSLKSYKTLNSSRDKTYSKYNIGLIEQNAVMSKLIASYSSDPMISKIINTFVEGSCKIMIKEYKFEKSLSFKDLKFLFYERFGFIPIGYLKFNLNKIKHDKIENFVSYFVNPPSSNIILKDDPIAIIYITKSYEDYNFRKFDKKNSLYRENYL